MEPGVIAFLVLVVAYFLASEGFRHYYEAKYQGFFETGHYNEAIEALNRIPARVTLTTYRQYYLRFLCYQAMDDEEMATRMIELLVRMRNSAKRQAQTLAVAFNYFTQLGNKERCKELLDQLKTVKGADKAVIQDCQLTYDIVFSKKHDYIDQMEQMLKKEKNPALQGKLCFLLWKQYANKGDKTHSKQYKRRFEELTKSNTNQQTAA